VLYGAVGYTRGCVLKSTGGGLGATIQPRLNGRRRNGRCILDAEHRLRVYTAFADNTRKWVTIMDAKAGFLSALNGVLIAFLWAGMRLGEGAPTPCARTVAVASSLIALLALLVALWSMLPRESPRVVFGGKAEWTPSYQPFSFYGFVSTRYMPADFSKLETDLGNLDETGLAREALEQHFTISHVVRAKSVCVTRSGYLTVVAIVLAGAALLLKVSGL